MELKDYQARVLVDLANYLDVLDAERSLFQAELDEIDAQRNRLSAVVGVYKALGGGWQPAAPAVPAAPVAAGANENG